MLLHVHNIAPLQTKFAMMADVLPREVLDT